MDSPFQTQAPIFNPTVAPTANSATGAGLGDAPSNQTGIQPNTFAPPGGNKPYQAPDTSGLPAGYAPNAGTSALLGTVPGYSKNTPSKNNVSAVSSSTGGTSFNPASLPQNQDTSAGGLASLLSTTKNTGNGQVTTNGYGNVTGYTPNNYSIDTSGTVKSDNRQFRHDGK